MARSTNKRNKTADDENGAPVTRDFILKPGLMHSYILNGERVKVTGDGKQTIPLTEKQFPAFKDKVVVPENAVENTKTQDAVDAVTSGVPQKGASSGASAASSGTPVAATEEDAEVLVADATDKDPDAAKEDEEARKEAEEAAEAGADKEDE